MMAPPAQPPPAATSHSPLKAAIDTARRHQAGQRGWRLPAKRVPHILLGFRQPALGTGQTAPARPWEQEGVKGQRGQGLGWGSIPARPGPSASLPLPGRSRSQKGEGRWAQRTLGKLPGSRTRPTPLLPGPLGAGTEWGRGNRSGLEGSLTPQWSEGPEPTGLASGYL